eukprot:9788618-Prorocentrum_lima.AAC.1
MCIAGASTDPLIITPEILAGSSSSRANYQGRLNVDRLPRVETQPRGLPEITEASGKSYAPLEITI